MTTKQAQQKTHEGILQNKEKNKTSVSPQGEKKKKHMLKYQPKEEKINTKFHKINQMTGINT